MKEKQRHPKRPIYTMNHRIFASKNANMKVTALIPDDVIAETKKYSGGKNTTESLLIALKDYLDRQRIKKSVRKLKRNPLKFKNGFSADAIRKLNQTR
jgi:hypothetical protein